VEPAQILGLRSENAISCLLTDALQPLGRSYGAPTMTARTNGASTSRMIYDTAKFEFIESLVIS